MFLNQIDFLWREFGRARGARLVLLLIGPLLVFAVLALLFQSLA